jgi:hypothetical protein
MRSRLALRLLATLVLLPGCRDAKVTSYQVPKETPEPLPPILTGAATPATSTPPAAGTDMASTAVPTAGGDALTWTAPAHWKQKSASAMRKGSYAVPGTDGAEADMAITAFPGDVGGNLANINRWRGQLQLGPIGEADLGSVMDHVDIGDLHVDVVDFANDEASPPQRMIGAIVPHGGATWFFKLMGPDSVVAKEKPVFLDFLKTIKTSAPAAR